MCMLTYFPPMQMPDADRLRNGAESNNDGHGYAIVIDGEVVTGHGMDADVVIDEFMTLRALYPEGPAMFHSRWSTHGVIGESNCHPFKVPRVPNTVVAHNGILPLSAQPMKGDWRSDTRIFAEEILMRKFPVLDSAKTRRRLESWLTSANKIIVLTTDKRYAEQAYILNEKQGIWSEGIWYSNSGYMPTPKWVKMPDGKYVRHLNGKPAPLTGSWDSYYGSGSSETDWEEWYASTRSVGVTDDGLYYSDSQGRRYYSGGREGYAANGESTTVGYEKYQCNACGSFDIDPEPGLEFCLACQSCLLCECHVEDCECWPGRVPEPRLPSVGIIADDATGWPKPPMGDKSPGDRWAASTRAIAEVTLQVREQLEQVAMLEQLAIRDRTEAEHQLTMDLTALVADQREGDSA